jgi:hypothetical protein
LSSRLLNGGEHMTTEHTVVRSDKLKRKLFNSNLAGHLVIIARPLPSVTLAYRAIRQASQLPRLSHPACASTPLAMALWLRDAVAAFLGAIITRWHHKQIAHTLWQQRCLEVASRLPMLGSSMRRVGLIDITVGNATRLGASQRSTTRRCASHHIATQRLSRWGSPAACARLARTAPSSACGSETPTAPAGGRNQGDLTTRARELVPRRPTRRFTPAGLTSVGANRLEGSVQGPWTSWGLQTRQRS